MASLESSNFDSYRVMFCSKRYHGSRPITWLVSSHVSANEGWAGGISTTMIFFRILSDGGYCKKGGTLAERYLG